MSTVITQIKIPRDNGLNKDAVINTWHHVTVNNPPSTADKDAIVAQLLNFYTSPANGAGTQLVAQMAKYLNGPIEYKLYNLADAKPRSPIRTGTFAASFSSNSTPLPGEVALVLSLRADPVSGVDPKRLRGRVYLGPWGAYNTTSDTADGRPDATLITNILAAAKVLMDAGNVTGAPKLVVYSEAGFLSSVVTKCVVNDAWDTQRRRGAAPTANSSILKA